MTEKELQKQCIAEREAIKECGKLVLEFFGGDTKKTTLWFDTPNPNLGEASPNHLFKMGRAHKVLKFIKAALDENKP